VTLDDKLHSLKEELDELRDAEQMLINTNKQLHEKNKLLDGSKKKL